MLLLLRRPHGPMCVFAITACPGVTASMIVFATPIQMLLQSCSPSFTQSQCGSPRGLQQNLESNFGVTQKFSSQESFRWCLTGEMVVQVRHSLCSLSTSVPSAWFIPGASSWVINPASNYLYIKFLGFRPVGDAWDD
ncbi:uncharacterized protein BJX67DRAFT_153287 [Aspergillus lucknowensis]|uniref:Secreted protein n=1 Tax=Aspergillus lucknowensis TaxID=176173 RepID=A0ABR4LMH2_9EURO